jgi:hypothetical protein
MNTTNSIGVSTTHAIDASKLTKDSYTTSRFGIVSKSSLLLAFNKANRYLNPYQNIDIRFLSKRYQYIKITACKLPTEAHPLHKSLIENGHEYSLRRINSVDCLTEHKRDANHLAKALSTPALFSRKKRLENCLHSIRVNDHVAYSENPCGLSICPICSNKKYSKEMRAFRIGLNLLETRIPHLWSITLTTEPIELNIDKIREKTQQLSTALSNVFSKSKLVAARSKTGSIIGTCRKIEIVYGKHPDTVFIHAHLAVALNSKVTSHWIKDQDIRDELNKHIQLLDLHIKRDRSSYSVAVDTINNCLAYINKPLGLTLKDRDLTENEKQKLNIPSHYRPSISSIRNQPLKFYRAYLPAIEKLKLKANSGVFRKALALGKSKVTENDKMYSNTKEKHDPHSTYAVWADEFHKDNTDHLHDVGEYKLLEPYARQLIAETTGTPIYTAPKQIIYLDAPIEAKPSPYPKITSKYKHIQHTEQKQLSLSLLDGNYEQNRAYLSNNNKLPPTTALSISTNINKDVKGSMVRL